ncbi:MAG: hypothetical protein O3C57_00970 [Verrucomicrobia bacterium]|nr:hypothetical protein [Verrucomicrobiota bacterium]
MQKSRIDSCHSRHAWSIHLLLLLAAICPASAEDTLPAARAQYEQHYTRIEADARLAEAGVVAMYSNALFRVAEKYQADGNLESLLFVRRMQDVFDHTRALPASVPADAPDLIRRAHVQASKEWEAASATRKDSFLKLMQNYVNYLENMKRKLTTEGDLAGALKVRDEISRAQDAPALSAAMFEEAVSGAAQSPAAGKPPRSAAPSVSPLAGPEANPEDPEGAFRFRLAPWGDSSRTIALVTEGDAALRGTDMQFRDGRIVLDHSDERIKSAFRHHNALTIEAVLYTASISQSGPARIISSSKDGYLRNFSLCQENDKLILRLRTSTNDLNGMAPQIELGAIQERTMHHVLISYRPGELVFYMDGVARNVASLSGDFSNWEAYPLLFGNELETSRPWLGNLRAVSIESFFVGPEEALRRFNKMPREAAKEERESVRGPNEQIKRLLSDEDKRTFKR